MPQIWGHLKDGEQTEEKVLGILQELTILIVSVQTKVFLQEQVNLLAMAPVIHFHQVIVLLNLMEHQLVQIYQQECLSHLEVVKVYHMA